MFNDAAAQDEEFAGEEEGPAEGAADQVAGKDLRKYRCTVSESVYDPAEGDPDGNVAAGTSFADLPDTWTCPDCGAMKSDFEPLE